MCSCNCWDEEDELEDELEDDEEDEEETDEELEDEEAPINVTSEFEKVKESVPA